MGLIPKSAPSRILQVRDDQSPPNSSFIGNTPSTVLFFLALAVGVLIAFLFVFFTIRYFVRQRCGLYARPMAHRNIMISNMATANYVLSNPTDDDLRRQIEYIRGNHFVRQDVMNRILNRRRRGRRGRYSKMKRLTQEQVSILFPEKTYADWLHGGKEEDSDMRDGVLHEEGMFYPREEHGMNDETLEKSDEGENKEIGNDSLIVSASEKTDTVEGPSEVNTQDVELDDLTEFSKKEDNDNNELHFSSGSCAICLELLSDDHLVRGLICGHVFHSECLDPWLTKRRACCPMCKRDYYYKDPNKNDKTNETANVSATDDNEQNNDNNNDLNDHNTNDRNSSSRGNITSSMGVLHQIDEDAESIDIDELRNDPNIAAMLEELIPVDERVRMVLSDTSLTNLRIEERANDYAKERYGGFFKRIWWRIMGITVEDFFNYFVLKVYKEHIQSTHPAEPHDASNSETSDVQGEDVPGNNSQEHTLGEHLEPSTSPQRTADVADDSSRVEEANAQSVASLPITGDESVREYGLVEEGSSSLGNKRFSTSYYFSDKKSAISDNNSQYGSLITTQEVDLGETNFTKDPNAARDLVEQRV